MIKISYELVNGYVQGWHVVTEQIPAMFEYTHEFNDIEEGQTADEQLQHFNDNYLDYTAINGTLNYNAMHKGFELQKQKQDAIKRIAELKQLLNNYDKKVIQHERCHRMGITCKHDIAALDLQAEEWVSEINELEELF